MKKTLFILTAIVSFVATLTACSKKQQTTVSEQPKATKTLVAYFSATGTTEAVARMIAAGTGGELYKIQPEKEYSAEDLDWTVPTSRCSQENNDPASRPAIVKTKESLDAYDTIYLGFPNWWNMAPRIINTFVETYSLKGKRVIPFMTSGGSTIENSVALLRKDYPEVQWQDGQLLNAATQDDVDAWLKTLE